MDANCPAEGQRGTGTEHGVPTPAPRPPAPVDGDVVIQGGVAVFWCEECARWINAHIQVDGAKEVHRRISHPT
jgi:hypothetical protein